MGSQKANDHRRVIVCRPLLLKLLAILFTRWKLSENVIVESIRGAGETQTEKLAISNLR
jgi:hypothetical protein